MTALFDQVFERLEDEFDDRLVKAVLTLLASARRGLSERELRELTANEPGAEELYALLRLRYGRTCCIAPACWTSTTRM